MRPSAASTHPVARPLRVQSIAVRPRGPVPPRRPDPSAACALGLLLACAGTAFGQASFHALGALGEFGNNIDARANALSADGSTVVGSTTSPQGYQAFRWTLSEGMVGIGFLPGRNGIYDDGSTAYGVSADGSVIVGQSSDGTFEEGGAPFRWTRAGGMVALTHSYGLAYSVTDDGSFITGEVIVPGPPGPSSLQAFRWTPGGGLVRFAALPTGVLPPDAFVFHDGSFAWCTVAGYPCTRDRTYRWDADAGWSEYPAEFALIHGFTRDGQMRIGNDCQAPAYRWTQAEGFTRLGTIQGCLDNGTSGFGGASADGSLIVGLANASPYDCIGVGFIWDPQHGMRNLHDVLVNDYGLTEVNSWGRLFPSGVSADGRTICGTGDAPSGGFEPWVVRLPGACAADFDADGTTNIQDFLAYLQAFANGASSADMDHNQQVNLQDFLAYLAAYARGCG